MFIMSSFPRNIMFIPLSYANTKPTMVVACKKTEELRKELIREESLTASLAGMITD